MASLQQVVTAMSKELNDSTLGWDVVVNYSAKDINAVLKSAYDKNPSGQLKDLPVSLNVEEELSGLSYVVDYNFQLGPPLIQFEASSMMGSSCHLGIPVIGGSVVVKEFDKKYIIPDNKFHFALSGIALAAINGTKGADRNPQPSNQPFVFKSPDTTGAVSLDIETSAKENLLQIELSIIKPPPGVPDHEKTPMLDNHLAEVEKKILTHFKHVGNSIHWDIAQINNIRPSKGDTQLVPKVFRFACYSPDESSGAWRSTSASQYTVLSLFIHLHDGHESGTQAKLQEKWSVKWSKPDAHSPGSYGVPPIPDSFSASVILNHKWIQNAVTKSVKDKNMKIEDIPKTSDDAFSLKSKILTGQRYQVDKISHTGVDWPYSTYIVNGIDINLDNLSEPNGALYISIGQNGASYGNAHLQWQFDYTTRWTWIHGSTGQPYGGNVKITNKLDKWVEFRNDVLPDYRILLDLQVKKNSWTQTREPSDPDWYKIIQATNYGDISYNRLPDPPTFELNLFDIDFFMTTNLLLPNQRVMFFDEDPGVLFPRDLYLVGHVVNMPRSRDGHRRPRRGHCSDSE